MLPTTTNGGRAPSLMIKNLAPIGSPLMERGKIKIGQKGAMRTSRQGNEFQPPQKLDHFIITTLQRGQDGNFLHDEATHKLLTERGFTDSDGKLRRIPVRLLFDDMVLNFQTRYVCYQGKTLWCTGDGEQATRVKGKGPEREVVACPCHRIDPTFAGDDNRGGGKCKPNGVLSVMVDGAGGVGGVWKFRTTSYNSILALMGSMVYIERTTGGALAGIPLQLVIRPKTGVNPIDGQSVTIYVVGLEFAGNEDQLREIGYGVAKNRVEYKLQVEQIEQRARLLLAAPSTAGVGDDDDEDVIGEFYPEEAAAAAGVPLAGQGGAPRIEPPSPPPPPPSTQGAAAPQAGTEAQPGPQKARRGGGKKAAAQPGAPAGDQGGAPAQQQGQQPQQPQQPVDAGAAPQIHAPGAVAPQVQAPGAQQPAAEGTLGIPGFLQRPATGANGAAAPDQASAPAEAADDYF
jgi:hypothetical protein